MLKSQGVEEIAARFPLLMFASYHGKEDVSVLAGPHLHTGTGFAA